MLPVSRLYLARPLAVRPPPFSTLCFSPRPTLRLGPASTLKPKDTLFVVGGGGGMFGSVKVIWVIGLLPPPAGVVLYEHVGGNGGGIEGGGNGGADGGWQCPSQSIM